MSMSDLRFIEVRNEPILEFISFDKIFQLKNNSKYYKQKLYKLAPRHTINQFIGHIKQSTQHKTIYKLNKKYKKLEAAQTPTVSFNEELLKNLTTRIIPKDVKFAVQETRYDVPINRLIADVEHIITSNKDTENHNLNRGKASNIIANHLYKNNHFTTRKQLVREAYKATKSFIQQNPVIIITKADKGNVTIAMYKTDYNKSMDASMTKQSIDVSHTIQHKVYKQKTTTSYGTYCTKKYINVKTKKRLLTFTARAPRPRPS